MTTDQLKSAVAAQPFRPFVLCMADGRSYRVPHREFLAQTGGGRIAILGHEHGDGFSVIDLLLVNELRFESSMPKTGKRSRKNGNGAG
jgi:hypothetical protein